MNYESNKQNVKKNVPQKRGVKVLEPFIPLDDVIIHNKNPILLIQMKN